MAAFFRRLSRRHFLGNLSGGVLATLLVPAWVLKPEKTSAPADGYTIINGWVIPTAHLLGRDDA